MDENKRGFKILFYISFIPLLILIYSSIMAYFNGITFFFSRIYGFDALTTCFVIGLISYSVIIPIFPVCLLYQIIYILKKKGKIFKKIETKKLVITFIIIVLIINLLAFLPGIKSSIEKSIQKKKAIKMIDASEVTIPYNENDFYAGGLFDIEGYIHNYIFIDYDKMKLGILHRPYVSGEYYEVKFKETEKESNILRHIKEDYYIQIDKKIDDNTRLVSFYVNEQHRTIAFILIRNNKYYYIDNIYEDGYPKYFGLNRSNDLVKENTKFEY